MSRIDEIESAKAAISIPQHEFESPDLSRRVKIIRLTGRRWDSIKCHEWAKALLSLPPDAELCGIQEQDYRNGVIMLIRSREFEPVKDFEEPPDIRVLLRRRELGEVDGRMFYSTSVELQQ